ncbi:hypothetical protein CEXT_50651 [Caerostris extrusa]|uniref:Transmembrane protein n=1 Tax=Caerostris extrusa TaxID=172846 RepID=A0AAV4UQM1_CAEEX|nr:hypothetical protein CEXT_50651 [Caerostris extrusa]
MPQNNHNQNFTLKSRKTNFSNREGEQFILCERQGIVNEQHNDDVLLCVTKKCGVISMASIEISTAYSPFSTWQLFLFTQILLRSLLFLFILGAQAITFSSQIALLFSEFIFFAHTKISFTHQKKDKSAA